MENNLFIKKIVFERDKVSDFKKYPFSIPYYKIFRNRGLSILDEPESALSPSSDELT